MIVKLTKGTRSYYAAPYTFTERDPEQEVPAKLGKYLLGTGYFKEVERNKNDIDIEEEIDTPEEQASKQKELYDKSQEEAKKKSVKKDK